MASNIIQRALSSVRNYVFPTPDHPLSQKTEYLAPVSDLKKDLRGYITPVQLQRIRHDISLWRMAIAEAEQAWYPHRVRMQRMFIDTVLNGHTLACVKKRKDLTLLRNWSFRNSDNSENTGLKNLMQRPWFTLFLEYALEARFYGYSLIALGDLQKNAFPDMGIVRRFNVSPERLNVTSYVYSLTGDQFLEEPYADWHVWVPTPSDVGTSKCGYGELYSVAQYEILARNLLGNNADAGELYGVPVRVGKTTKGQGEERDTFEQALANMGGSGYILMDPTDEIDLIEPKGNGQGFKIFPDLESRLEKKISKLLLGHADAIDSVPGTLGAAQGGKKSPAGMALVDKQTADGIFLENVVNESLMPKLIKLGFVINTGCRFQFDNNQEKVEQRANEDENNLVTANIAYQMKQSGLQMDAGYFEQRTGIPTKEMKG